MTETQVSEGLKLRLMTAAGAPDASRIAIEAFDQAIAPLYGPEGVREFHEYATPGALASRLNDGNFTLLATEGARLVGMAEVRGPQPPRNVFVSSGVRRNGTGRLLLARLVELCRTPGLTWKPSPSTPHQLRQRVRTPGFMATGEERTEHGIRSTPMELRLAP